MGYQLKNYLGPEGGFFNDECGQERGIWGRGSRNYLIVLPQGWSAALLACRVVKDRRNAVRHWRDFYG